MKVRRAAATLAVIVPFACTGGETPTAPRTTPLEAVTESSGASSTAASIVVGIDVRPNTVANRIPLNANGTIPVAILGAAEFDVTTVDPLSLAFGPADGPWTSPVHDLGIPGVFDDHLQDVNEDGFIDLVTHYRVPDLAFVDGDELGCLTGATLGGDALRGCDPVTTKP
ncbi:MAG: hypothetical protein M8860_13005 [marine benthic group bacterium]|jgi:hypothetical protein|nr:hypothetical protein [Gemmatimonadota bacterium]MCL7963756.1 hypothetical protein [Candidatus Carthagonibacter metallireducens]MCL7958096.1 hypothetical protein [Gemmatimonadota bacterium]MCL7963817.1 hypothetical protein [Gemmatimonadota bacterium]MCL7975022.1 hypothetical protein [Gemmatimonadota bacterium]